MKQIAAIGSVVALTVGITGCGAQQSVEHAATSAGHVVEQGEKAKKELEQAKAKLEKDAKELRRKGKAAREALERQKGKGSG
jgi:Skp family chaperone for outer membrane proteins